MNSTTALPGDQINQIRQRLHKKIGENNEGSSDPTKGDSDGWDSLWKDGMTPWDLKMPTPALREELLSDEDSLSQQKDGKISLQPTESGITIKSLVPGCGSGYDLVTIAKYHEELLSQHKLNIDGRIVQSKVVGLDISSSSLDHACQRIQNLLEEDDKDPGSDSGRTRILLQHGDFFRNTSDWQTKESINPSTSSAQEEAVTNHPDEKFDFIFDYTFFCALPPTQRSQWAKQMSALIQPNTGRLLTFMFPILPVAVDKEDNSGGNTDSTKLKGPPYPVTVEEYKKVMEPCGFQIVNNSGPYESPHTHPSRAGKELLCWWELVNNDETQEDSKL